MQASSDLTAAAAMRGKGRRTTAERSLALVRGLLDIATGRRTDALAHLESLLADLAEDGDVALEVDALDAMGGALARVGQAEAARGMDQRARSLERATATAATLPPQSLRRSAQRAANPSMPAERVAFSN